MSASRKIVLSLANNKLMSKFINKYGMRLGAQRFVASESLEGAVEQVRQLNKNGLCATLDHLGESVSTKEAALKATNDSLKILEAIDNEQIDANISLKLTQLGLDIDYQFCLDNMHKIVSKAAQTNNFVRIDMEDSPRIDPTLDTYKELLKKYGKKHIGIVIQSYLYRSETDLLNPLNKESNIRIVKGAYHEPASVAYSNKKEVDNNYINLVKLHIQNDGYAAIATHDEQIINTLKNWSKENSIETNKFEFQMLYGIRPLLQKELADEGYKVRVYTPYGQDWYQYFSRRIAERPANALFILKNLLRK